jgi:peroxiredoxin
MEPIKLALESIKRRMTSLTMGRKLGAALAAFALSAALAHAEPATMPSFSLPDLDGKTWSSDEFKGKPLIVDFWATWCNTCKETIPKLAELQQKYLSKGLTVVGISVDKGSAEKIRKAAKKLGINYLVLLDKDNTLGSAFGFTGIPSLYVFDRQGKLGTAMPGYDPDQEKQLEAAAEKAMTEQPAPTQVAATPAASSPERTAPKRAASEKKGTRHVR